MATLSSSSTFTEVVNEYIDNASYLEDASTTKAKAFVTACMILLIKYPEEIQQGNEQIKRGKNLEVLHKEKQAAEKYIKANRSVDAGGPGVKYLSVENFRNWEKPPTEQ